MFQKVIPQSHLLVNRQRIKSPSHFFSLPSFARSPFSLRTSKGVFSIYKLLQHEVICDGESFRNGLINRKKASYKKRTHHRVTAWKCHTGSGMLLELHRYSFFFYIITTTGITVSIYFYSSMVFRIVITHFMNIPYMQSVWCEKEGSHRRRSSSNRW